MDASLFIIAIEKQLTAITNCLNPDQAISFKNQYYEIIDRHQVASDSPQTIRSLQELISSYPDAQKILSESDPHLFQPPAPVPAAKTDAQGGSIMTSQGTHTQTRSHRRSWSPEMIMQLVKEAVTAILAIMLLWSTLNMAEKSLIYVGDTQKMSDAKDVLLLLMGLAGVVLGYYFGRIPADARAAQAQQDATEANIKAEAVTTKAEQMGEKAVNMVGRMAATRRDGSAGADPAMAEDIRWMETQLSELRSMARSGRGG